MVILVLLDTLLWPENDRAPSFGRCHKDNQRRELSTQTIRFNSGANKSHKPTDKKNKTTNFVYNFSAAFLKH